MKLLILLISLLVAQQDGRPDLATISGQIRGTDGTPAAGVRIAVTPAGIDTAAIEFRNLAKTDSAGRYRLENVEPGRYLIVAGNLTAPSFFPGVNRRDQARIVTVAAGQMFTNIDFKLTSVPNTASDSPCISGISGSVRLDDGSPLPTQYPDAIQFQINGVFVDATDSLSCRTLNIRRIIANFRPGENTIAVVRLPPGHFLKSMTLGGIDVSGGTFNLTPNLTGRLIEVILTKTRPSGMPPGVRVSGQLANLELPNTSDIELVLKGTSEGGSSSGQTRVAADRKNGTFFASGVLPGNYILQVSDDYIAALARSGVPVSEILFPELNLKIGENDIGSLTLQTKWNTDRAIKRVSFSPISILSFTGAVESSDGNSPQFEIQFTSTRGAASTHSVAISGGTFSLELPEGEYRASISGLPNGYAAKSIQAGPLDLTEPFLVTKGGIADRITGSLVAAASPLSVQITVQLTSTTSSTPH